jgi:hypothetical protein
MSSSKFETLKNMNTNTGKHAVWCIVIHDPKVIPYTFKARGESVNAERFQCVIGSSDPKQYMMGSIPFSFTDRGAAKKALEKFKDKSVWILKTPAFDTKSKTEYISCPQKNVLILQHPSKLTAVLVTSKSELEHPSKFLQVGLNLKELLGHLQTMQYDKTASRAGATKTESKVFDLVAKIVDVSASKTVEKAGTRYTVAEMTLVDKSGKVKVSAWGTAIAAVANVPDTHGVTLIGVTATRDNGEVKLNLWPSAHVIIIDPAQSLTSLDASGLVGEELKLLTAQFTPTSAPIDTAGDAYPTCAAALEAANGCIDDKLFQMNYGIMDAPTCAEDIKTKDGRFFVRCQFRDRTGCVEVFVIAVAVPALYNCKDEAELWTKSANGELECVKVRVNVRGVMRSEGSDVKKYIGEIVESPLMTTASPLAMRAAVGLAEIIGGIVIPAPAQRATELPMIGLAVIADKRGPVAAHRILLLVQGNNTSTLETVKQEDKIEDQSYKVTSNGARCLLSDSDTTVNLVGYCNTGSMLTYRLDREVALVLVSAVTMTEDASISGSTDGSRFLATVEYMQKIGVDDKASLLKSLETEWKSVLLDQPREGLSPSEADYWNQKRNIRRCLSAHKTPEDMKRPDE